MSDTDSAPDFLTTKEVAALLRVRERRVYELAAAGEIPCRRAIGKLLFPRKEITSWLNGDESEAAETTVLPRIIAGSHDPLLDWAIRESRSGLATSFDGSLDGIRQLANGTAQAAGSHVFVPEKKDWNTGPAFADLKGKPVVVVEWARRQQGLILARNQEAGVRKVADLKGKRVIRRQDTAGAAILFNHLLAATGLTPDDVVACGDIARTETEAAAAVAAGKADAAPGLESVARQFDLGFLPTMVEIFDLIVYHRAWFDPPIQTLMTFTASPAFQTRAQELGGYDIGRLGAVRRNGI
ncbi:MAG: helix-turn-helix transcriptional regulator [Alphaproteobacteria bacterium]